MTLGPEPVIVSDLLQEPILVVVAHADDEVLGCGAVMAKLAEQNSLLRLVWLAQGRPYSHGFDGDDEDRSLQHVPEAIRMLGLPASVVAPESDVWAPFPAGQLEIVPVIELARYMETEIARYRPRTIITHWFGDVNQDHQRVFHAVEIAARAVPDHPVKTILCMEVLSSTHYALKTGFEPNVFVPINVNALGKKMRAMSAYETEIRPWPHPRSNRGIETLARFRGMQCGYSFAEAFVLVRTIL